MRNSYKAYSLSILHLMLQRVLPYSPGGECLLFSDGNVAIILSEYDVLISPVTESHMCQVDTT